MVGIIARMQTMRGKLALVRNGFGAAVMPPDVKRLALQCAVKINDGHMGPRKFWRLYMPRLKYHNPEVQMDVIRTQEKGGPATLTVEFEGDRKEVLDVQHKHENDIINMLFQLTQARQLPINDEDSRLADEYLRDKEQKVQTTLAREARYAAKREEAQLTGAMPAKSTA